MKLQIFFNNATESVNYESSVASTPESEFIPIEVQVYGGGKKGRQSIQIDYLKHLTYVFGCMRNTAGDFIKEVSLSDIWFLNPIHKGTDVQFGCGSVQEEELKYDIVIYDLSDDIITEHMYLTRNQTEPTITKHNSLEEEKKVNLNGVTLDNLKGNTLNANIMAQQVGQESSANILGMIAITEKYLKGYHLKWNVFTKKLILTDDKGSVISYVGIKESDIYTVIKLFTLLLEKGSHIGVFYINTVNMRTSVLEGLLALIKLVFKNKCLVFLYNCDYLSKTLKREVMRLPNYYVAEGKK